MESLFERFDRLDTRINRWLVAHSITLLRIALGRIFLAFGLLKFFPGVSPIEALATRTTTVLSFGLFSGHPGMVLVAALECAIGLCFATGRFLRIGVWLLAFQMLRAMSPLLLFPGELFAGPITPPACGPVHHQGCGAGGGGHGNRCDLDWRTHCYGTAEYAEYTTEMHSRGGSRPSAWSSTTS